MRRSLAALALLAAPLTACRGRDAALDGDDRADALVSHVWIDHMPTGPRDTFHVLVFDGESRSGVYNRARFYKGEYELFGFRAEDDRLTAVFPDDGTRLATRFAIREDDDQPPFDARLTFAAPLRGPTTYLGLPLEQGRALLREHGVPLPAR